MKPVENSKPANPPICFEDINLMRGRGRAFLHDGATNNRCHSCVWYLHCKGMPSGVYAPWDIIRMRTHEWR